MIFFFKATQRFIILKLQEIKENNEIIKKVKKKHIFCISEFSSETMETRMKHSKYSKKKKT